MANSKQIAGMAGLVEGWAVHLIVGTSSGVNGAMQREDTEPLHLDLNMPADSLFSTALPAAWC